MAGYATKVTKEAATARKEMLSKKTKDVGRMREADYKSEVLLETDPQAQLVEASLLMAATNSIPKYTSSGIFNDAGVYTAFGRPKDWADLVIIFNGGNLMAAYVE